MLNKVLYLVSQKAPSMSGMWFGWHKKNNSYRTAFSKKTTGMEGWGYDEISAFKTFSGEKTKFVTPERLTASHHFFKQTW